LPTDCSTRNIKLQGKADITLGAGLTFPCQP
jgi:hypothetical protein